MDLYLLYLVVLVSLPTVLLVSYALYVRLKGRPHYDRVDRQVSGAFLSKRLMEVGYFGMQPFARLLVFFGVTPNQLSWVSLGFGLLAGVSLAFGHFGFGAGFGAIASVLDMLDGMVARMTGVASEVGEVLDSAMDRYVEFFFLSGLIVYYRDIPILVALTLLTLIGSFMVSYSSLFARAENVELHSTRGSMRRPERVFYLLLGAALSPVTIPWLEQVREFPVPIGHPMVVALGLVAVFSNSSAIEQFWQTMKTIRVREDQERKTATQNMTTEALEAEEATARARQLNER